MPQPFTKLKKATLTLGSILIMTATAQAADYDYFDIGIVEATPYQGAPSYDGYTADFSFSLGSHFFLKLGFDNISFDESYFDGFYKDRIKSRRFGGGFRSELNRNVDFVAQFTKQRVKTREEELINDTLWVGDYTDKGDITDIGLRGELFRRIEWDAFLTRETLKGPGLSIDETGYTLAARYQLMNDLSVGLTIQEVGDRDYSGVNIRFAF